MAEGKDGFDAFISESALSKTMPYKDYDVNKLRTDGGTQQRPIDPEIVKEYTQRRKDGDMPPPARAVLDPEGNMWLWEGFHRRAAAIEAGQPTLNLAVTRGTVRDAIALSFTANKSHGLRRQPGVVRHIIEKIVADGEWGKASAAAIAAHVGASQRYVESVIEAARAGGKERAGGGTRTVTRGGKTYEMDTRGIGGASRKPKSADSGNGEASAADEPAKPEKRTTTDELGQALTDEKMVDVFTRADEVKEKMRALAGVKREVLESAKPPDDPAERKRWRGDPLYTFLNVAGFEADLHNAWQALKRSLPFALCPSHADDPTARKDCKWCEGKGWVTKANHTAAVESQKQLETASAGKD